MKRWADDCENPGEGGGGGGGKFLFICFPKVDDRDDESYGDFSGDLPLC